MTARHHEPYMPQAEKEVDSVAELASQIHDLLIETAAKVADDDGESRGLLLALGELSTAERQMWEARQHLADHRALELYHEALESRRVAS